jgi:hypothetical protein
MPVLRYETGIEQDAEVLGEGWTAHLELSRNRVHGAVGLDKEIQHPATRKMANGPKDIRGIWFAIGSYRHVANIYVRQHLCGNSEAGVCRLVTTCRRPTRPVCLGHREGRHPKRREGVPTICPRDRLSQ